MRDLLPPNLSLSSQQRFDSGFVPTPPTLPEKKAPNQALSGATVQNSLAPSALGGATEYGLKIEQVVAVSPPPEIHISPSLWSKGRVIRGICPLSAVQGNQSLHPFEEATGTWGCEGKPSPYTPGRDYKQESGSTGQANARLIPSRNCDGAEPPFFRCEEWRRPWRLRFTRF